MKIVVKATNIKLSPALRFYIEEKIGGLEKFIQKIGIKDIKAWVEVGKITKHHQKGDVFRAEVQLRFPDKSIRSEAIREDLRLAVNEVKDELQREFKQYTARNISKEKRAKRVIKKDLHLSPEARFYRRGRIREEGI